MSDVTRILLQIEAGDPAAADQLLPFVYDELRKLAAARLAQEKPGQTLQATALVHDAYIRLVSTPDPLLSTPSFQSRGHFFAAAAEAMRRILVERARQKLGPQRGGDFVRVDLEAIGDVFDSKSEQILAIHAALDNLAEESPPAAQLVKLRYFGGLTHQEAATALGISRSTADRLWAFAKAALFCDLQKS